MAMDAKLGLVVGLGVVLTVAVTYYPKNGPRRGTGTVLPPRPAEARAGDVPAPPVNPQANSTSARLDPH